MDDDDDVTSRHLASPHIAHPLTLTHTHMSVSRGRSEEMETSSIVPSLHALVLDPISRSSWLQTIESDRNDDVGAQEEKEEDVEGDVAKTNAKKEKRVEETEIDLEVDMPPSSFVRRILGRKGTIKTGDEVRMRMRNGDTIRFRCRTVPAGGGIVGTYTPIALGGDPTGRPIASARGISEIIFSPPVRDRRRDDVVVATTSTDETKRCGESKTSRLVRCALETELSLRSNASTFTSALVRNRTVLLLSDSSSTRNAAKMLRSVFERIGEGIVARGADEDVVLTQFWTTPSELVMSGGLEGDSAAGVDCIPERVSRLLRDAAEARPSVVVIDGIDEVLCNYARTDTVATRAIMRLRRILSTFRQRRRGDLKECPIQQDGIVLIGLASSVYSMSDRDVALFDMSCEIPCTSRASFGDEFDVSPSVPHVPWDSVGGAVEAKRALTEAVVWPMTMRATLDRIGVRPCEGILLTGPPGVGKTLLAKAVATAANARFLTASVSTLVDGAAGESAACIRRLFRAARRCAPVVVFLDEFQSMFGQRSGQSSHSRQLISQLLYEFDQNRYHRRQCHDLADEGEGDASTGNRPVVVLAATNMPRAIDRAFFTPGRFDRVIRVDLPDRAGRVAILRGIERSMTQNGSTPWPRSPEDLASQTTGYSGADLASVIRFAVLSCMRRTADGDDADGDETQLSKDDFSRALSQVRPSVTPSQIRLSQWDG